MYAGVVPKIGLEVHAQLKLNSKLFSQGATNQVTPNSKLDLLDLAIPGSLPKLNRDALRAAILTSIGLNCRISPMIHFDRKNYSYYDMPAGYQITQHNKPLGLDGHLEFITHTYHKSVISHSQPYDLVKYLFFHSRQDNSDFSPYIKTSRIKQIQLEHDSAKTLHKIDDNEDNELYCLVDYNRCGTALVEIVFEPDLTNHHEASSLIKELITILKSLDTCDCQMAEGSLRVDANVSLQKVPSFDLSESKQVELKNLNSIGFVNRALLAEIQRQTALIMQGKSVERETRFFDPTNNLTKPLRLKEESIDYRFVPEPSIPPLNISREMVDDIYKDLPMKTPKLIQKELIDKYKVDLEFVVDLMKEPAMSDYYMKLMDEFNFPDPNVVADFLIYTVTNLRNISGVGVPVNFEADGRLQTYLDPRVLGMILEMVVNDEISYTSAYEICKIIFIGSDTTNPRDLVEKLDWFHIKDDEHVERLCMNLIREMKSVPKKYKKRGSLKDLRMMLDKLIQLTNGRISVRRAIDCLDRILKPNKGID